MNDHAPVLDACCGSRMFWYDPRNENAVFMDNRELDCVLCDGRTLNIHPDVVADFRNIPFSDGSFHHVVFDPPHFIKLGKNSWLAKKYGMLSEHWQDAIRRGFKECMRVLKPYGTLVFKWNAEQISTDEIVRAIGCRPLYGNMNSRRKDERTVWMVFLKMSTDAGCDEELSGGAAIGSS